ncbi:S9 family peptidase [Shewanella sp. JM162201]|uniref:S9 family peptidase n=1 Tax=Shewanella jiangmenensis TaxID=2837387 RepID=A0ABS5VA35_9GAMM|nr:S9 family peptidase [Shewanella jiangmenensis]MBT1446536.1 S9 family peptidase [Shewanella jiangmenensis]
MTLRRLFAAVALCALTQAHAASPEQVFARGSQFSQVKLSPGGEYLSAITKHEGKNKLLILDTETLKMKHAVFFPRNAQVGTYAWVNDERIVLAKEYLKGWSDHPIYYGELYAVNADGSRSTYLFGYNSGEQQTGSNLKKNTAIQATAYILDPLHDDEKFMLVEALPWSGANWQEGGADVYKVDVYRGTRKKVTRAPISYARFLTDSKGEVRVVSGEDKNNDTQVYFRNDGDWISSDKLNIGLDNFVPLSFAGDEQSFYAAGTEQGQTQGVYKINLQSGEKTKVIQDDRVDPANFWINEQTNQLYAVEFADGYPTYAFVDSKDERSQLLKSLLATLPGHQVQIVSEDRTGNLLVVFAANDRNPGDYYLFDRKNNKMRYLVSVNDALDLDKMAEVKPFDFTARDGTKIQAYLTLPQGVDAKNLPLVVNPHGGPHFVRDSWSFDAQNQLLASQGIAVLQVNFRGSGGYGRAFEEAGYGKWGSDIQHDIIDATRQVIADGTVDKDRICIVGGSFGGYSALQSSALAPDLFKCAIGFAGVYDLELMFKEGDVQTRDAGMAYLKKVLTQDKTLLKSMSPTHNVDKLKASILLVHGGNDERAPIEQYEAMADALKKANYPFKSLVMDDEGHGFYNEAHRAKYYAEMMDFLKPHLKL